MDNIELADLIWGIIKEELKPINDHLEVLEVKHEMTHRKLDNLEFAMRSMEHIFKKDIHVLQDALIVVMEAKGILPRAEGRPQKGGMADGTNYH